MKQHHLWCLAAFLLLFASAAIGCAHRNAGGGCPPQNNFGAAGGYVEPGGYSAPGSYSAPPGSFAPPAGGGGSGGGGGVPYQAPGGSGSF